MFNTSIAWTQTSHVFASGSSPSFAMVRYATAAVRLFFRMSAFVPFQIFGRSLRREQVVANECFNSTVNDRMSYHNACAERIIDHRPRR